MKKASEKGMNDHDLLIEIKTKVDRVIADVANLSSGLVGKVDALALNKADRVEFERCNTECQGAIEKIHNRVETLENWRWYIIGIGTIIVIIVDYLLRKL